MQLYCLDLENQKLLGTQKEKTSNMPGHLTLLKNGKGKLKMSTTLQLSKTGTCTL